MKMRLVLSTTWVISMSISTLVFAASDPVGRWQGNTPQGPVAITIAKGDGDALTGELDVGPLGIVPLDEVVLDGDTLTWNVEIDAGGQFIVLSYSGEIAGDAIDGTIDAGDFGQFPIALARVVAKPAAAASGGLLGEWDLAYEIQGNAATAKLILAKAGDGAYSGTWDSQFGKSELKDVKVNGDSATFSRSISAQGQEMDISYSAEAAGDSITGTIAIPQLGDVPFTGKRVGGGTATVAAGHIGKWDLEVDAQGQIFPIELTVADDAGGLAVNTSTQMGDAAGSDVAFADGTLTFMVSVDAGGQMMEFEYSLTIDGDSIEGTIGSEFGDMPVAGKRAAQ